MPDFNLPHLNISERRIKRKYKAHRTNIQDNNPKIPAEHGALLRQQLNSAFRRGDAARPDIPDLPEQHGSFLEITLAKGKRSEDLEKKKINIRPGASQIVADDSVRLALYVPIKARDTFNSILDDYTNFTQSEEQKTAPRKGFVEAIEEIREAQLNTFWTDSPDRLPSDPDQEIWWELWCYPGSEEGILEIAQKLGATTSETDYWMKFPEATVVQLYSNRATIELLLYAPFGLLELRLATITPSLFNDAGGQDQYDWAANLAERVIWPANDVASICLLDTGVNRGHVLIEPALSESDTLAHNPNWGGDDHKGHGTQMAGLALHGDIYPKLADERKYELSHRLESIKLLPPSGFPANNPGSLDSITQAAVAKSEVNQTDRSRVFCLSITNEDKSGARPSSWSAAIDQAVAGAMEADDGSAPKRLFLVSCGNIPAAIEINRIRPSKEYPIEDPSQAWNALTVGGYTNKKAIDEDGYEDWDEYAEVGDLSPHSRTSESWLQGKSPFKPEIVMEAGNRAISPSKSQVVTLPSLGLLTTGDNVDKTPFSTFNGTSAAVALASRLAAKITAFDSSYWPETVRALIVHSARWTPSMVKQLQESNLKKDRYSLLRRFGWGVPSFERATASASSHVALIAQSEIQPFENNGGRRFADCHYYDLPWPKEALEQLGDRDVTLRITLSYFIEPNPGFSGSTSPQRYQSFGLRFDLKRPRETDLEFAKRNNAMEDGPKHKSDDEGWALGPNSISAGSLHCDEWTGSAAKLASRDLLCIKPVIGWWRERSSLDICNKKTRYSLVVTISTPNENLDLHAQISNIVDTDISIEIPVQTES